MTSRRFLYASLVAETNTFSNIPIAAKDFEREGLLRGPSLLSDTIEGAASSVRALAQALAAKDIELVPSIFLHADSGGRVQHAVYERYREMIVEDFSAGAPFDAILLFLHGAMVSTECLDCEGDLLARLRDVAGPNVPIGAMLDPHAHLTNRMIENATVLNFMREYPHIDGGERLREVVDIVIGTLERRHTPVAATADCHLIGLFPTSKEPMRGFVDSLAELERQDGILSVSFVHGFPWGDTPDTGAKALVYADRDRSLAQQVAARVRDSIWAIRRETALKTISPAEMTKILRSTNEGPIVFADIADNPGGGTPSDSTFVLRTLLDEGIENVAVGFIYDPQSVEFCHAVGTGGRLKLRVGGKTGIESGQPIDIDAVVMGLSRNAKMSAFGFYDVAIGDTAWVRSAGIDVVLNTRRHQLYDPSGLSQVGIEPARYKGLVVKSTNHFLAGFGKIARAVHYVSTPGAIDPDFSRIPYREMTRPYFPRMPNPRTEALDD